MFKAQDVDFSITVYLVPAEMRFLDIFSFILSILGTYGIALSVRFLLPRNVIRRVSTALNEGEILLNRAEATGAIPTASEYRTNLAMYEGPCSHRCHFTDKRSLANQVLRFRMESHRSPGLLQQLRLVFRSGLTCRLYVLSSRIEVIKLKVEVRRGTILLMYPPTDKSVSADGGRPRTYFGFHLAERYNYGATCPRSWYASDMS